LLIVITAKEHLGHLHWLISNSVTFNAETHFSATHPIRRFLKPHTFHAVNINAASTQVLLPNDSLLYRTAAFNEENWFDLFQDIICLYKYETLEEHFAASQLPQNLKTELPVYEDGFDMWKIHGDYVNEYVDIFYDSDSILLKDRELLSYWEAFNSFLPPYASIRDYGLGPLNKDNLKNHLTHFIWWVTGGHEFVGSVTEYILDPSFAPFRVIKKEFVQGKEIGADYKTFANTLCIMALTGVAQPSLIGDWKHLHQYEELRYDSDTKNKVFAALDKWQGHLQNLILVIDDRNTKRSQTFNCMNPRFLKSAVSI
jgi:hypothetical protein